MRYLDVLSSVLDLQPTGDPFEFKTLCPFHPDRHPSLYVNFEKGVFYCFGCHIGGTISRLLKLLKISNSQAERKTETATIEQVLRKAQQFFRDQLRLNPQIRNWLASKNRERFIDYFGLGYAPADPKLLREALSEFSDELLISSGLFSESMHPILLNRVTIPITSPKDGKTIIAFAGRAVREDQQPKFINTRNSALFNKRTTLFNLFDAQRLLSEGGNNELFVVEGYFDAMHLAMMRKPAVALMGAALTPAQAAILVTAVSECTQKRPKLRSICITLMFDPDHSGMEAMIKTASVMSYNPKLIRAVILPKDPDELEPIEIMKAPRLSVAAAFIEFLKRTRLNPKEAAKLLLDVPTEIRKNVFLLLHRDTPILGRKYIEAIQIHFSQFTKKRTLRVKLLRSDFWELVIAAILSGRISPKTDLPDLDLSDIIPSYLKNVYLLAIGQPTAMSESEERLYAKLAISNVPTLQKQSWCDAIRKAYWKRKISQILEEAQKNPSDETLMKLREQYLHAVSEYGKYQTADPDRLIDTAEFLESFF